MGSAIIYLMLIIVLHPISGAHLNPAITIGQAISSQVKDR
jgi:glycerol uptake facilitator-like aquaporin